MTLEYRIGNRKVSKTEWERHLREEPLRQVKEEVKRRIEGARCPVHGTRPSVAFRGSGAQLQWDVSACCEQGVEAATRAIGS
jgi:hypothetical protein